MALRNVSRVTFSLPKAIIIKMELNIPKNKRSKFVAESIEKNLAKKDEMSLQEIHKIWDKLANMAPDKTKKTALEIQREDRLSH